MSVTPQEMRLRDVAIGLQAELDEANYHREKLELSNAKLHQEIQDLTSRLLMAEVAHKASQQLTENLLCEVGLRNDEIIAIRQSYTWRVGTFVLTPIRWAKRRKS